MSDGISFRQFQESGHILGRRCGGWLRLARRVLGGMGPGQSKHICFGVRKRKLVSIGTNSYSKTHPTQRDAARRAGEPLREYLHAEIAALVKARGAADGLIVLRFQADGSLGNSCPCDVCRVAISLAGIKNVYHS